MPSSYGESKVANQLFFSMYGYDLHFNASETNINQLSIILHIQKTWYIKNISWIAPEKKTKKKNFSCTTEEN